MGRVLLDTTVLIDALRGRGAAVRLRQLRAAHDLPFVCAVSVEEILRGVRPGEEPAVERLLNGLLVAPMGRAEGERAGTWRRSFAARGHTLSQSACLVAAAALGLGARLATGNPRDFPMPEVLVDHWPAGT
jgi:predicted nucleic acid-binding protein